MKLEYQFSSVRIQCQKCSVSLKNLEHPVLLQDEETRLDLCYDCFSVLQSDLQYLARWKYKGASLQQAKQDKDRLEQIAHEMADFFSSSPSRYSVEYNLNVLKVFYLERLKVIKESLRSVKGGKLFLSFHYESREFQLVYEPIPDELVLNIAEEFAP